MQIQEVTGERKYIYFSKGEISLFSSSSNPRLRIGEILVRQGKLTREVLKKALELQKDSKRRLGEILIKSFDVDPKDIQAALETKICEEIYDLFLLKEAEFEFFVDELPEKVFDSFERNLHISLDTTKVLAEGLRLADEWKVIQKKIRTFDEIFVFRDESEISTSHSPEGAIIYDLVDGEKPVHQLFENFPGSRTDCCRALFEFLGAGAIRPLSFQECMVKGDSATRAGETQKAIWFLEFAVQLTPHNPEPLVLVSDLYTELGKAKEGDECRLKATGLYFEAGKFEQALELGQGLLRKYPKDQALLDAVFQSSVHCGKDSLIGEVGDRLANLLVSGGLKTQAAEVLLKVSQHHHDDLDWRLKAADLLKAVGDTQRALTLLQESLALLQGNQFIAERIKFLRLIFELAPERHDVKQQINSELALQEALDQRKRRRFTLVGVASIVVVVLMVVPILYEIKANELLSHARRLEEISIASGNFIPAKDAYREFLSSFNFSIRCGDAKLAIERIEDFEQKQLLEAKRQKQQIEEEHAQRLREIQETLAKLFDQASRHEQRGEFQKSFQILNKISQDFPNIPQTKLIRIPLTITSNPKDCEVRINGQHVGRTPVVVRYKNGKVLDVRLTRAGCEDGRRNVTVGDTWKIHFDMRLRPLGEFQVSGPIHRPVDVRGETIYFPARDGFFYSVDTSTQTAKWRRLIGRYGDLTSGANYEGDEIILGNVTGELAAFSRANGKARWRQFLKTTLLATPALSPDRKWVAVGDLNGKISIINNLEGELVATFQAEDEILRKPVFWRYLLVAASEDNNLYLLSVPDAKLLHAENFSHVVSCDPLLHRDLAFFTTLNGVLHAFDLKTRQTRWSVDLKENASTQLFVYNDFLLVGTESGKLLAVRSDNGTPEWNLDISTSPLGDLQVVGHRLFLGDLDGEITAVDLERKSIEWVFASEESFTQAPVVIGSRVYMPSLRGRFYILEMFR